MDGLRQTGEGSRLPRPSRRRGAARLAQAAGFLGLELGEVPRGDQVELLVISRWQSMEAIKAFAGADLNRAVVEPGAKAILTEYDDFVTHYEVTLEAMGA